jgi:hypothetical protein
MADQVCTFRIETRTSSGVALLRLSPDIARIETCLNEVLFGWIAICLIVVEIPVLQVKLASIFQSICSFG